MKLNCRTGSSPGPAAFPTAPWGLCGARQAGGAGLAAGRRAERRGTVSTVISGSEKAKDSGTSAARLGEGSSGSGASRSHTAIAVAGVPREPSGWIWIYPVSGALPALEPNSHNEHARLPYKGGEVLEVDYVGMSVTITNPETGEIWQSPVFVATLPASSYTYAEVQPSQELQHWLAGHVRAFTFFGGVPKILRPDNLKTGVKKPNYYEPDLNPSYQELAEHYQVTVLPARVRKPKDKPHVENGVQNVERWVLAPLRNRTFFSLGETNCAITVLLETLNAKEMQHLGKSRKQLFEKLDQPALLPLPERPYEFARWKNARVSIDYHIAFEGHYYSVPHTLVGQEVQIRATERMLEAFHKSQQVAIHPLSSLAGRYSTSADPCLPTIASY